LLSQRRIMFSDPTRRYFAKTRQVKYSGMKERPESLTMLTIFHGKVYVLYTVVVVFHLSMNNVESLTMSSCRNPWKQTLSTRCLAETIM